MIKLMSMLAVLCLCNVALAQQGGRSEISVGTSTIVRFDYGIGGDTSYACNSHDAGSWSDVTSVCNVYQSNDTLTIELTVSGGKMKWSRSVSSGGDAFSKGGGFMLIGNSGSGSVPTPSIR